MNSDYSCVDCGTPLLIDFLSGMTNTCPFCVGRVKPRARNDVPDWESMTLEQIITVWRLTLYFAPAFTEEVNGLIIQRMRAIPVTVSETGTPPLALESPPPQITDAPDWVKQWIFPVFSRQHRRRKGK